MNRFKLPPDLALFLTAVLLSTGFLIVARAAPPAVAETRVPITLAKFGPSLAGLLIVGLWGGRACLRALVGRALRWRVHPGWWLTAILGPGLLFALARFVARVGAPPWLPDPSAMVEVLPQLLAVRILLGGGLGEEIGWRGVLLPLLVRRYGPAGGALATGALAGLWHLPANGLAGTLMLLLLTVPWGVLLAWMYAKSGESLVPCILAHGAGNAWAAAFGLADPSLGLGWMLGVTAISWVLALLALRGLDADPTDPLRSDP